MVTTSKFAGGGAELSGTALTTFTQTGGQVDSDIVVEWDFDNDGDFSDDVEDVTSYLVSLDTQLGRDFPSQLTGKAGPGRLRMTLRNDDDRFSFFNVDSPLTQQPFSLKTGRKIRVRTVEAANPDPTLLVRDRFRRDDSSTVGTAETGQTWTEVFGGSFEIADQQLTATLMDQDNRVYVNAGTTDYVVQTRLSSTGRDTDGLNENRLEVLVRYSGSEFIVLRLHTDGALDLSEFTGGVLTQLAANTVEIVDDMILTVEANGSTVNGYVDGLRFVSTTSATVTGGPFVGVNAFWSTGQSAPAFDEFYVWDGRATEEDGVIWTGDVEKIVPRTTVGPDKTVEVTAVGRMAKLATQVVPAPRYTFMNLVYGHQIGVAIGHVLGQAGLLHPSGPGTSIINDGTVDVGPIAFDETEGDALTFIRRFEDHELGFFYETPEGYLRFDQRDFRTLVETSSTPQVTFSDAPGAQFGYSDIQPFDREREIVNRVVAGVAPQPPGSGTLATGQAATGAGVRQRVQIPIDAGVGEGDLVLAISAWAGGSGSGETWLTPQRWVNHRDVPGGSDQVRTRIYHLVAGPSDAGTTVTLYDDAGSNGGSYINWVIYMDAGTWYGVDEGVHVVEFAAGSNPRALIPPWGAEPTLYVAVRAGLSSVAGASVSGATYPLGYLFGNSGFQNGATNSRDVGLQIAYRWSVASIEDPGSFGGTFSGFTTVESTVIAIRGFNGSPPAETVVEVQVDDYESQDDHNRIATYVNASNLHLNEVDAEDYGETVLATYSTERPIFEISFPSTLNAAYRAQAVRRRVSDRITLVAHHETGMLSEPADFFIENVSHSWSSGGKRWVTTWQLSPA